MPYTFNDENYYIRDIVNYKYQINNFYMEDAKDNSIHIKNGFMIHPRCSKISSLKNLFDYLKKNNDDKRCLTFFNMYHTTLIKKITINSFNILVYTSEKSEYNQNAIIEYNQTIVGEIDYISSNKNFKEFYLLLESIKMNKNIKDINHYILNSKKNLHLMHINRALKYAISGQIISEKNPEVLKVLKEILNFKKEIIFENIVNITRPTPLVPSAPAVGFLSDTKSQNKLRKETKL